MNQHLTDVILLLDSSSSMEPQHQHTLEGVNAFIKSQHHVPGKARFTVIRLRESAEEIFVGLPFIEAPILGQRDFTPIGSKGRLNAIGHSIKETARRINALQSHEQPAQVIFIVFTHGEEPPCSQPAPHPRSFTPHHVKDLMRLYRMEKGWQIFYVACDIHAAATAATIGVNQECQAVIEFSPVWIGAAWRALSRKVRLTRLKSIQQMDAQALGDQHRALAQLVLEEEEWWSCRKQPESAETQDLPEKQHARTRMQRGYTDIIFLLDRSGSMGALQEPAVASFNDFVKSQMEVPGGALLTLVQFNDEHETTIPATPIREMVPLDAASYTPRGTTALLDAIAYTIADVDHALSHCPEEESPGKVILAIFTDGLENASTRYTANHVGDLISLYRSLKGWEFIFLGANQDAIATACALRMDGAYSGNVDFSAKGIEASSRALHRLIRSMRMQSDGGMDAQGAEDALKPMEDIIREEVARGGESPPPGNAPTE